MTIEQKSVIFRDPTFDDVLDTACERLREKHIQYSIRRIDELDEELARLEKQLDDFMQS